MQEELIEMLEEIIQYVEVWNAHDQGIIDKAEALVEKAKKSAKEPAAQGWSDNQVIRFAAMILQQGNRADSIEIRLHQFREDERLRGNAAPAEPFGYFRPDAFGCRSCAATDEGAIALYERPSAPAVPQGEPWYGHKFKEVTRGVWCCECGKTITEGVPPCMNGTLNISTTQHDAVSMDATQMPDAGSAGLVVQGEFTRADGSRSSLRGSGTKHDPFVADNLDDLAATPSQEPYKDSTPHLSEKEALR